MKVIVVCQYYYPEPFRISDICEELVKMKYDVTVLTGLPNYPEGKILKDYRFFKKRKETINDVNIIRTLEIGRGHNKIKLFLNYISFALSSSFKILFMKKDFDIIFVYQLSPILMCLPAIIYKKLKKKKLYIYCLDLWPESLVSGGVKHDSFIYRLFYKISRKIYNYADMIFISSMSFREYFENVLKINTVNIKYLPQYSEETFNKNIKIDNKKKKYNFMFAGNIGKLQNVETIIMAANELKKEKNIFFHIVGDGSELENCKKITTDLKLENIIFHGRHSIEEMPKYYSMADAMLVTLCDDLFISYTVPGKIQSYMAAGKPIIGAINGEAYEIIKQSKCGFCCSSGDYVSLSKLILEFINSDKKDVMAKNSLKYYQDNYTKNNFFNKLDSELKKG